VQHKKHQLEVRLASPNVYASKHSFEVYRQEPQNQMRILRKKCWKAQMPNKRRQHDCVLNATKPAAALERKVSQIITREASKGRDSNETIEGSEPK
jgi:hypothetical protein